MLSKAICRKCYKEFGWIWRKECNKYWEEGDVTCCARDWREVIHYGKYGRPVRVSYDTTSNKKVPKECKYRFEQAVYAAREKKHA